VGKVREKSGDLEEQGEQQRLRGIAETKGNTRDRGNSKNRGRRDNTEEKQQKLKPNNGKTFHLNYLANDGERKLIKIR
jgi:hypothetical protein